MALSRLLAPAIAAVLCSLPGCSIALKTAAEQCTVDADCEARGGEFAGTRCVESVCQEPVDPKWGCVGNVEPLKGGALDTMKLQLIDLLTRAPVTNVTVKVCNKYDPDCAHPLATPSPDAMGWVTTTVASDIEAYLDIQSADYLPSIVFVDHVAWEKNTDIQLVTPGEVTALAMLAKVTITPDTGLILAATVDCQNDRTAGVSTTISPSSGETRFYVIGDAVTPNASQTDSSGNSGFINVPPGTPTITGTLGPDGKVMGKVTTLVRPNTMTYQLVRPTPTL